MKEIDGLYATINNYTANNDYDSAINTVNNYMSKDIKANYKEKLNTMMNSVTSAKNNYETSLAQQQQAAQSATPFAPVIIVQHDNNDGVATTYGSVKSDYLNRLNSLASSSDAGYINRVSYYDAQGHAKAAEEMYYEWDSMINEIWGVLGQQLSEEQMSDLTDDELEWISRKDQSGN